MNNMVPNMTLGPFVIKPIACSLFYTKDWATKDKRQYLRNIVGLAHKQNRTLDDLSIITNFI
jgi:hypothetical protein